MRFTFADAMCDPSHYVPLAQAAEHLGFDTFAIGDSICYPETADGEYPYLTSGNREFLDGAPFIDPFQLIAALSTVTSRLRFRTAVLKLPIREPVLVAKQVASLAVWTGNRFELGVGLSPWVEDFRVTHTNWKTRARRIEQQITIVRGLMSGDYFSFQSDDYDIPRIKLCPVPSVPVPIIYGGHTDPALRRAARLCDGLTLAGGTSAQTIDLVAKVNDYRRAYGRLDVPFIVHAGVSDLRTVDDVRRLEDAGVTELTFGPRNPYLPDTMTVEQKVQAAERFAGDIMARA